MTTNTLNRRIFLNGLAVSTCLTATGWPLQGLASGAKLVAQPLNDRITLITGAGGNVVVYRGTAGLTLIDSGAREHTSALLSLVKELYPSDRVTTLFNTHCHDDHTGGNEAVHALGSKIIAHENTKLWLGADYDVYWRNYSHKPRPAQALPDVTFYGSGSMDLGGETVQYIYLPRGHTDGDIVLYFPTSKVMVTGGLLTASGYPIADIATGGWIGEQIDANKAMLAMIGDTDILVPDSGPALNKPQLQAQHDMLEDLYKQMKALEQDGLSGHDMLKKGVTKDYDATHGDPKEFVLETYRGMWAHTYDMGGFI